MARAWRRYAGLGGVGVSLLAWTALGSGSGCSSTSPAPTCLGNASQQLANAAQRAYSYDIANHTLDARGVDWVGDALDGVDLEGSGNGCFVGGRLEGTWSQTDPWDLYHGRKALSNSLGSQPLKVENVQARNFGDGVSLELSTPCPNSGVTWLEVSGSMLQDMHDDAIESDGLCGVDVNDTLIARAYVAFAFRPRVTDTRSGHLNTVSVRNSLVRMHAFASNYEGGLTHQGIWKWAKDGRGPQLVVRNTRFLAFDPPAGGSLLPPLNRLIVCSDNVLLFAGSEAEWQQALVSGCDLQGNDGLCDGQRLLQLGDCFTVITRPDTQSEPDFLAEHWLPYVTAWKDTHTADDE